MVISHDRWFLDRIATHILAAEGDSKWTFFDGNYQEYEADKKKRLGEEGAKPKRIRYKPISRYLNQLPSPASGITSDLSASWLSRLASCFIRGARGEGVK
jgi:hypothetical protein